MTILDTMTWLETLPASLAIAESDWLFPAIESVHVLAITLVVGSIMIVDLRLLGLTSHRKPVTELTTELLPWTWAMFVLAAISGMGMFISRASTYYDNPAFLWKMGFLVAAAANMGVFHLTAERSVEHWDQDKPTLLAAKIAGALSLILWIGVIAFGRWIGFTDARG